MRFSEDFPADAAKVLETACSLHLEGVIAKRRDGLYTSSRCTDWLKLKCQARQEFVIGGFSDRSDNAKAVGALMLGYYDDQGVLQYAGRVGTGWSSDDAVALRTQARQAGQHDVAVPARHHALDALARQARRARITGSKPQLVAEISFAEWTPDGSVRHASYQGLREDKDGEGGRARAREGRRPTSDEGRDREEEDAGRIDVHAEPEAPTSRRSHCSKPAGKARSPAPPRSKACASRTPSA